MRRTTDAGSCCWRGRPPRRGATVQALGGLGAGVFTLWALTGLITVLVGLSATVHIAAGSGLFFALAMVATAVMFLAVGALTSQLGATRRQAASYAAAFLGVSYAVRMIADAGVGLHGLIWASPLGWVEELRPLTVPQPLALLPIAAFTVLLAAIAVHLAGTRDVGASILPDRASTRARPLLLTGPTGLAIRMMRSTVIGWWVAIAVSGLLFGLIAKSAGGTISGSSVRQVFSKLGAPGTGAEAVLGVCFLLLAVLIAFVAAGQITAARSEESEGRLDHILVCPVSRSSWLGGRLLVAVAVLVLSGVAAGVFAWAGAASEHTGLSFTTLLEAGVNLVPPQSPSWASPCWRSESGPVHVGRCLRAAGLVASRRDHRRHRSHQPLGSRYLGVPPDGVRSRRAATLGGQWFHGRHRGRECPHRRYRVRAQGRAGRMSRGRPRPSAPAMSSFGDGTVVFADLTDRARIREAALQHFAEAGYERATIRAIAQTAGVSPGLLRHHFGSKDGLRQACNDYVFEMLRRLKGC